MQDGYIDNYNKVVAFARKIIWISKNPVEGVMYCEHILPNNLDDLMTYAQAENLFWVRKKRYVDKSDLSPRQNYISIHKGDAEKNFVPTMWEILSVIPFDDLKGVTALQITGADYHSAKNEYHCKIITYTGKIKILGGREIVPQHGSIQLR